MKQTSTGDIQNPRTEYCSMCGQFHELNSTGCPINMKVSSEFVPSLRFCSDCQGYHSKDYDYLKGATDTVGTSKRKVNIFKWVRTDLGTITKEYETSGIFHQFGVNFEEFENGAASYTTAIVELGDGTMRNIDVEMIQFVKE